VTSRREISCSSMSDRCRWSANGLAIALHRSERMFYVKDPPRTDAMCPERP
jgi:hypothetical protein